MPKSSSTKSSRLNLQLRVLREVEVRRGKGHANHRHRATLADFSHVLFPITFYRYLLTSYWSFDFLISSTEAGALPACVPAISMCTIES